MPLNTAPPTCASIITDALFEIGVLSVNEAPSGPDLAFCLQRLRNQINSWQADRLSIFVTTRTLFTLVAGTSSVSMGPGATAVNGIEATRPEWFIGINYLIPGANPPVEVPMGQMDDDSYMNLSIKALSSNLPMQWYYNQTFPLGTLTFWPVVNQNVTIALYYPDPLAVPDDATTTLIGPPGYAEAFMYQLALRLCTPYGRPVPPLLPGMAAESYAKVKRVNTEPGLLGIDQGLVPSSGGGYNILSDSMAGPSNR